MENSWHRYASLMVWGGLTLGVLSWVLSGVVPETWLFGAVAGGVLAAAGLVLRGHEVGEWLGVYWLVLVFAAFLLLAIVMPEAWVEKVRFSSLLPIWVMRFLILFVLQGAVFFGWMVVRDPESFQVRRAGVAANVMMMVEVGLGLLVLVNALGASSLGRWIGSYDATETKLYSLGERTEKLLDSLSDLPASVYGVYIGVGPSGVESREKDLLRQYAEYTSHFVMKEFDGDEEGQAAQEFLKSLGVTDTKIGDRDTVIFVYRAPGEETPSKKVVEIRPWDFVTKSPLGINQFVGEKIFTSAIQDVVLPKKKVYVLEGHREHPLSGSDARSMSYAADLIRNLSLSVDTLNLAKEGAIPKDADLLIIPGPETPLLDSEREAITGWLDRGGSLILMVDPRMELRNPGAQLVPIGLENYLAGMGVVPKIGYVCVGYEGARAVSSGPIVLRTIDFLTDEYSTDSDIPKSLRTRGIPCFFAGASPILKKMPENAKDLDVNIIVSLPPDIREDMPTYAAKLYPGRDPLELDPGQDLLGTKLPIALTAEKKLPGPATPDHPAKSTRIVVFGDSDFVTNGGMDPSRGGRYYAPGHATLLTNAVSWAVHREQLISIEPKTLESEKVPLTEEQRTLARTVSIYALPLLILSLAIGAAWRRRR